MLTEREARQASEIAKQLYDQLPKDGLIVSYVMAMLIARRLYRKSDGDVELAMGMLADDVLDMIHTFRKQGAH